MTRLERWRAALAARNQERNNLRARLQGKDPEMAVKPPAIRVVPQPEGTMMLRRGNSVVPVTRKQASLTTTKSWKARKQQFGKAGRASKRTFK